MGSGSPNLLGGALELSHFLTAKFAQEAVPLRGRSDRAREAQDEGRRPEHRTDRDRGPVSLPKHQDSIAHVEGEAFPSGRRRSSAAPISLGFACQRTVAETFRWPSWEEARP
jgi:hypothetical protein